ncbi:MAG: O-antigen ligase family protein [Capsulimonadaceae bacterium]|nr:O-antigen ligase family protein [Capsulimonadaceae bacterium]
MKDVTSGAVVDASSVLSAIVAPIAVLLIGIGVLFYGIYKPDGAYELLIFIVQVLPAFILAGSKSKRLLPYILTIWAVAPEIRRVYDWSVGTYHPVTILSLAPLACTAALIYPVVASPGLSNKIKRPMTMVYAALAYGLIMGLFTHGAAALYDAINYGIPPLVALFLMLKATTPEETDRTIRTFGLIACGVSAYAWIQYITCPAWDAFWLVNVGREAGSMGKPLPLELRPWSTLNSPGPCAAFLSAALLPMIVNRKWRGLTSWAGVMLISTALLITGVRSSWLTLVAMLVVYIGLSNTKSRVWSAIGVAVTLGLLVLVLPYIPGHTSVANRIGTFSNISQDGSYQARAGLISSASWHIFDKPAGAGMGAGSRAGELSEGGDDLAGISDNGYLVLVIVFGIPGAALVLYGLFGILQGAWRTQLWLRDKYSALCLAGIGGLLVDLSSGNQLLGVVATTFWLLIGVGYVGKSSAMTQISATENTDNSNS